MKMFFLIVILLPCFKVNGQNDSILNFKNQGEQENYWAKEKFKKEYKKENYKRFGDLIIEQDNRIYKYDSQIFEVNESTNAIRQLFALGIIYPTLITTIKMPDSLTDGKNVFKNPFHTDTLYISNIEELKFFELSPKVKRFRFWLSWNGIANPFVYLFELTNESAAKETDMGDFIKGASLTFFKQGWIIL